MRLSETAEELGHCLERFEVLGRLTPEAIIIHRDDHIIYANSASTKLLGAERVEDLVGRRMDHFVPESERARVQRRRALVANGAEPEPGEYELLGLDGVTRTAFVASGSVDFGGLAARLLVASDITAQKQAASEQERLQARLAASQRLEAIGRLAGGIAHDFNNLLTVIAGYTAFCLDHLAADDPIYHYLEQIDLASERAAGLTHQLLAFGRQQVLRPSILDLNSIVIDMEKMLRRLIGEDVVLELDLEPGTCAIRADRGQIEQVIVNLVVNARDSMSYGGRILVSTRFVSEVPDGVEWESRPASECYARLGVRDEGAGMSRETMERIFEPFYTTKPVGGGTGLGLATVYGIVKQSRGAIEVVSEPEKGTEFKVYQPSAQPAPGGRRSSDMRKLQGAREQGFDEPLAPSSATTVLLVEDDAGVRRLAERVLTRAGYRVVVAEHAEAVQSLDERQLGLVDILVSDVVLPGIDGRTLSTRLKQQLPDLKILFISGYAEEKLGPRGVLEPGINLLEKPFTPRELLESVQSALADGGLPEDETPAVPSESPCGGPRG